MSIEEIKAELDRRIAEWRITPQKKCRPTCPCGHVGSCRTIRWHRSRCFVWSYMCNAEAIEEEKWELRKQWKGESHGS